MSTEVEALATTAEVAEFLRLDERTLKAWRRGGEGPPWVRVGQQIRYRWPAVEAWVDGNTTGAKGGDGGDFDGARSV